MPEEINYSEMQPVSEAEAAQQQAPEPAEQPEPAQEQPEAAEQQPETPSEQPEQAAEPSEEQPATPESERAATPEAEQQKPEATPPEQPEQTRLADLQNKIFEMTQGKTKDPEELLNSYKELQGQVSELSSKKPVINADTIREYNDKLKEEKGYDLATALNWSSKDIDSMSEREKLDISLRIDKPDMADRWYKDRIQRLDEANNMTSEKLEAKIEDLGLEGYEAEKYRREVTDMQLERENMLTKSQNLLKKHKESFDFNINFEGNEAARPEEQKGPSPEKVAEVKAQLSEAVGKIKNESLELDLPLELGKLQLEVDYTPEEKNSVIDTTDPDWGNKRYGREDGSFDLDKMMRDRHRMLNYESTMKRTVEKAVAETIRAYEAKRDNITSDKERKPSNQERDVMADQVGQTVKNFYQ